MSSVLMKLDDAGVESSDGWAVRIIGPEMMEYTSGSAACLVNVGYSASRKARKIYASESLSHLFPHLREHLQAAAGLFNGRYVVV